MPSDLLDKAQGCLLGLACGDYLGVPVEFENNPKRIVEFFGSKTVCPIPNTGSRDPRKIPGYYSDDTSMAICLAESLINNGFNVQDQFQKYQDWMNKSYATPDNGHAFGIGIRTMKILISSDINNLPQELKNNNDYGSNGALMRIAPLAIRYRQDKNLPDYVLRASIITHNNIDSYWSCLVLCKFIAYSLLDIGRSNFVKRFLEEFGNNTPDSITKILKSKPSEIELFQIPTTGYVLNTLKIALFSFFLSNDFETAISKAIYVGGDTDTQGAVTGALAGAYWGKAGIPNSWVETLIRKDYIATLASKLTD